MDDVISRQALLDKFEPWLKVKDYNDGELNMLKAILYEIRFMRSAQPEPLKIDLSGYSEEDWERLKKEWGNTPITVLSAQPKRGRWIKLDMHRGMADYKCTACKQECYVPTCMGEPMYAFCPNCGAKMEVTNE